MKKIILLMLSVFLMATTSALALPALQLDMSNGTYMGGTYENVVNTTNPFTLYALLSDSALSSNQFYISVAVTPDIGDTSGNYGSFTFGGQTIDVTADMTYGTPPNNPSLKSLPGHGIYDTWYKEFAFTFDPTNTALAYNSQDNPGGFVADPSGSLYFQDFLVDISGLDPSLSLHFDLYTFNASGNIIKAPFSHDAQSAPVPEPANMLLLGVGLIGLAGFGRRKFIK